MHTKKVIFKTALSHAAHITASGAVSVGTSCFVPSSLHFSVLSKKHLNRKLLWYEMKAKMYQWWAITLSLFPFRRN
jgi:hypothetical protein